MLRLNKLVSLFWESFFRASLTFTIEVDLRFKLLALHIVIEKLFVGTNTLAYFAEVTSRQDKLECLSLGGLVGLVYLVLPFSLQNHASDKHSSLFCSSNHKAK